VYFPLAQLGQAATPEEQRLEGTSGDCLMQTPPQSRINDSRLLRATSSQVFAVSTDRDSTASE